MIHAVGLFFLMLLKIAGWILLVLLAVILAVLLFVLFVPVRYRIFVQNERILESGNNPVKNIKVQAKISWLLHLIHFVVNYGPEGLSNEIYAAGADVRKVLAWRSRRKAAGSKARQNRKEKKEKPKKKEHNTTNNSDTIIESGTGKAAGTMNDSSAVNNAGTMNDSSAANIVGEMNDSSTVNNTSTMNDSSTITDDFNKIKVLNKIEEKNESIHDDSLKKAISLEKNISLKDPVSLTENISLKDPVSLEKNTSLKDPVSLENHESFNNDGQAGRMSSPNDVNPEETDSGQDTQPDARKADKKQKRKKKKLFSELLSGISKKLQAVKGMFHNVHTKIFTLKGKIRRFQEELTSPSNRRVAGHLWKELCYMLCRYKPRKVKADITFSLADPALTGKVLGIISMLPHVYRYPYNICADFQSDKLYIDGELLIQGKITGYVMVLILLRLFRDKECMQIVRRLMGRA